MRQAKRRQTGRHKADDLNPNSLKVQEPDDKCGKHPSQKRSVQSGKQLGRQHEQGEGRQSKGKSGQVGQMYLGQEFS
jgi:hypothetical protein